jgi:magnesium transporter
MKRLAAWAAMLAVPTAVTGIYGMNFTHMPELDWKYGFYSTMVLIAIICAFLYWRFHKSGWL